MRRVIVIALMLITVAAVAAPVYAAGYGQQIGHTRARGGSHATDIGWGAKLNRTVKAPHGFTVVVKSNLQPGYFCSESYCNQANVHWDVACSKPGWTSSREGGMFGPGRLVGHPKLPFKNPRTCTIHVSATPNSYVGGTIEMWLYKN